MLEVFFKPRSVAVVGASSKPGSLGWGLAYNVLSTFKGPVYLVNIRGGTILGRSVYRRLTEVPGDVELALVITPATSVPEVIEDAGSIGVRGVIVYSGGFRETGRGDLEDEVVRLARRYNIRLLGPNCVGVVDTRTPLNATFISMERQLIPGPGGVSIISQSGALGSLILDLMGERLIGLRRFASVGNASDVKMWELLELMMYDGETRVIGLYLESVSEGRRLFEVLARVSSVKPVVALIGGLSSSGSRAALTHVAALTTNARIVDGALRQARVVRARSLDEFIAALEVLERVKVKPGDGRIVVVTNTGGMGVLLSDSLERRGLRLEPLPGELEGRLRDLIPGYMALGNPIDLSGSAPTSLYEAVIREIVRSKSAGILVVINQPQTIAMDVDAFTELSRELAKLDTPIVMLVAGSDFSRSLASRIRSLGLPVASSPDEASFMVLTLLETSRKPGGFTGLEAGLGDVSRVKSLISKALSEGRGSLGDLEARSVMEAYGFKLPRYGIASTCDEVVRVVNDIGYPVVLKILTHSVIHKSDVGGVLLGLRDDWEVKEGCHRILSNAKRAGVETEGVIVEEYVRAEAEIALGALRDKLLGPIVMVGLGGYMVELLEDISFRLAPLSVEDAMDMVMETRLSKLVEGYRGVKVDVGKLADAIMRLSRLITDNEGIGEVDVNPLAWTGGELVALDVKIKLSNMKDMSSR